MASPSRARSCPFGLCDGSGFLFDERAKEARDCRCRPLQRERSRARRLQVSLPARFAGASFDRHPITTLPQAVVAAVRRYVETIEERLAEGRGLWFCGEVGVGKSTLALAVAKAAADAGHSIAIQAVPDLLQRLRAALREGSTELDLMEELAAVDLLLLDDLGVEQATYWGVEQLYRLIDRRYRDRRAAVVVSEEDPDGLLRHLAVGNSREGEEEGATAKARQRIAQKIISRLFELCDEPLPLCGEDLRVTGYQPRPYVLDPRPGVP